MQFKLYHANPPRFQDYDKDCKFPEGYIFVATVTAIDLEHVFMLTNHIDSDWTQNQGVELTPAGHGMHRSTSVGDIIVDGGGDSFYCNGTGWHKFNHKAVA